MNKRELKQALKKLDKKIDADYARILKLRYKIASIEDKLSDFKQKARDAEVVHNAHLSTWFVLDERLRGKK